MLANSMPRRRLVVGKEVVVFKFRTNPFVNKIRGCGNHFILYFLEAYLLNISEFDLQTEDFLRHILERNCLGFHLRGWAIPRNDRTKQISAINKRHKHTTVNGK
jgi:hypothetical protein